MIEYTFINDSNDEIIIYAYTDAQAFQKLGVNAKSYHCIRVKYVD